MRFCDYLTILEYVSTGPAVLPSAWTGSNSSYGDSVFSSKAPSLDFGLPSVTKTGKIQHLSRNTNPIEIVLEDGTRLFLTVDQFRRIKGNPAVGRVMTVVFERSPLDNGNVPSKINAIQIS